jgi:hypothetical protein
VILSVPLFTFTWLFSHSVLLSFLSLLVLEVGPSFVVAIVVCVAIGALEIGLGILEIQGELFVLPLCGVAISVFRQPASSHLYGFWVPFLHQNP